MRTLLTVLFTTILVLLAGCRPAGFGVAEPEATLPAPVTGATPLPAQSAQVTGTTDRAATATPPEPPPSPTPVPTTTPSPTPEPTATLPPSPSPTPLVACSERHPSDETLLTLVSRDYGLSRSYAPGDLVPLSDAVSNDVTLGYPTQVRQVIVEPLQTMIAAMQAEELSPLVVSGFRDYAAQSLAEQKWVEQYPEWAQNLSAPPGHSEHQLGTTVDFSSPDLPEMVGEEFIQFHPAFARSKEGEWLAAHAHEYGFTMSYPANQFEETAFFYEPWHFRYVGVDLATHLYENELTISAYLLERYGPPCIP